MFDWDLNTTMWCITCKWIRAFLEIGEQRTRSVLKMLAVELLEQPEENLLYQHLDLIQSFIDGF